MTVYVISCADPASGDAGCWTHGVYASREMAERVYERLCKDTWGTVHMEPKRIQQPRKTR